jgi:hypothetical protein
MNYALFSQVDTSALGVIQNVDQFDEFTNSFVVASRIPALIRRQPNSDWHMDMSTVRAGIDGTVFLLVFLTMIVICCLRILAAKVHGHKLHIWMYISQMIPNWETNRYWMCVADICARGENGDRVCPFWTRRDNSYC